VIAPYVYDAGALIALDRGQRAAWVRHLVAMDDARRVLVPSVVIGQVWRGGRRQHDLGRVLRSCEILPVDDTLARAAGELCGRANTSDVVDALVLATAQLVGPAVIWTSDPGDLDHLRQVSESPDQVLIRKS
jgi:predicted nucleic acid-binding protein